MAGSSAVFATLAPRLAATAISSVGSIWVTTACRVRSAGCEAGTTSSRSLTPMHSDRSIALATS